MPLCNVRQTDDYTNQCIQHGNMALIQHFRKFCMPLVYADFVSG